MKKIKRKVKKFFQKNYFLKNVFSTIQLERRKRYYKKYCLTIPTNEKMVVFESFLGKQYACSPKAIYEAMLRDERFNDYLFVWFFRNPKERRLEFDNKRTMIVKYNSRQCFRRYGQAKYWVSNWRLSEAITKKEDQVFIQTWHGTPLKKIGMDLNIEGNATTSQKKGHQMYLSDAEKYDYFISPSKFCTKVFSSAFGLTKLGKENVLIETGYPRNDFLFRYTEDDVKTIKERLHIPDNKKVILYAPTWRDNQHQLGVGYTFDMTEYIEGFLNVLSNDYVVIMRLHYLVANQLDLSKFKGKVFDYSKLDDINQLYIISDILITDYSSVFFDYANLKRPILFYMYDLKNYQSNVRDFYIDLKELPGPIIQEENELISAINNIEKIIVDYNDKYAEFNEKYNYLDDKNSGKRILDICFKEQA